MKVFGVGLGAAIMIDVLIVRMVVVPAVMTLLGDRAWWLPSRLERLLPRLELERDEAPAERERWRPPRPLGPPVPADAREG